LRQDEPYRAKVWGDLKIAQENGWRSPADPPKTWLAKRKLGQIMLTDLIPAVFHQPAS
jgi:hypothetical protein